jgi:hypothetical protein
MLRAALSALEIFGTVWYLIQSDKVILAISRTCMPARSASHPTSVRSSGFPFSRIAVESRPTRIFAGLSFENVKALGKH